MDVPPEPTIQIELPTPPAEEIDRIVIPFEVNSVGHLMVEGTVAGHPVSILIDTGASSSVFHLAKAREARLDMREADFTGGGVGSSQVQVMDLGKLELTVAGQSLGAIQIYAMDLSHVGQALAPLGIGQPDFVLGTDLLIQRRGVIDYGKREIRLEAQGP